MTLTLIREIFLSDEKSKYFDQLAILIASGESVAAASKTIGCSTSTGYKVAAGSGFKIKVDQLRAEFVKAATGKLGKASSDAVDVIIELMKKAPDQRVRLRAATTVLDRFAKLSEHLELRERIEALEASNNEH